MAQNDIVAQLLCDRGAVQEWTFQSWRAGSIKSRCAGSGKGALR